MDLSRFDLDVRLHSLTISLHSQSIHALTHFHTSSHSNPIPTSPLLTPTPLVIYPSFIPSFSRVSHAHPIFLPFPTSPSLPSTSISHHILPLPPPLPHTHSFSTFFSSSTSSSNIFHTALFARCLTLHFGRVLSLTRPIASRLAFE